MRFNEFNWLIVRKNWNQWWEKQLDRPLIQGFVTGHDPHRTPPAVKRPSCHKDSFTHFASFYDSSVSADQIVDVWDYDLCGMRFLGDAFPNVWPNFGAGTASAFLGADLRNGEDTIWFTYDRMNQPIQSLDLMVRPDNYWLKRVKDIAQAAVRRWQGTVQTGITDLGGTLDILATFRGFEQLMYDLFDNPEHVDRLINQIHGAWWSCFLEFESIHSAANPGYSCWAGIFSEKPYAMLQCDVAYMLGPDIFERFIKPELMVSASRVPRSFYHLDGPGQLVHLDSILEIETIDGIQWIPGANQPDASCWPQVYKKISDSGKKIQVFDFQYPEPLKLIDIITDQTGRADNLLYVIYADKSRQDKVERLLERYGIGQSEHDTGRKPVPIVEHRFNRLAASIKNKEFGMKTGLSNSDNISASQYETADESNQV